ncbi:hypothetical protein ACFPK9_06500 [Rubritalea spongiae]|uniref:DUF2721 domain-containing protein n=2 Tax=Rubritalea spongiae TaxID=430797 RepID=A0ABW5E4B9_9BACT
MNIEPNDVVHVEFGAEFQKFTASELVLKDGWKLVESTEVTSGVVEKEEIQELVDPRSSLSSKDLLRLDSAYSSLRAAINILIFLAYVSVAVTFVISLGGGIGMESIEMMVMAFFGAALSVISIYVVQQLLHAFVDIADAHIRKLD